MHLSKGIDFVLCICYNAPKLINDIVAGGGDDRFGAVTDL